MKVTSIKDEGLDKIFRVTIPQSNLNEAIETRLKEVAANAKIDGFRIGKVPIGIIKNRYGTQVKGEVIQKKVSESIKNLFLDKNIKPALQPKVDFEGEPMGDKDIKFKVSLEILPEIKILQFSNIKLERLIADVKDIEVDKALKEISKGQKSYDTIKTKRKAKKGDAVLIDFKGKIEGEYFKGGSSENHTLELGSGQMVPGFENQIIGMNIKEEKEIEVKFPSDYPNKSLAGKKSIFEIILKNIMTSKQTEIDENLAKNMGFPDLKTLKSSIKKQIESNYNKTSRNRVKRDLLDILSNQYNFEVPKTMLENENKIIWERFEQDRKAGVMDELDKGKKDVELKKEYKMIAKRRVRLGLLMQEIGSNNNITVTEDEVKNVITQEAKRYPGEENKVVEFYKKTPEALNAVRGPIYEDKVVDYIIKNCSVSEKKVDSEELFTEVVKENENKKVNKNKEKKTKPLKTSE